LVGASAQAGHFPAGNDPAGNGTVPAFTGQYILTIADGCFDSPGLHFVEPNSSCNAASVFSGTVDLYGLTGPPNPPPADSFSLVNDSFPNDFWQISEVFVNDDLSLGGVDTGSMGPYTTTGPYSSDQFWLQFNIVGDPVSNAFLSTDNFETEDGTSPPGRLIFGPECTDLNNCTVNLTPEPGSLGLLFAALGGFGGAWFGRRRRPKS
jgi:hypothetical protein